jgi:DNA replication protein DnaC
VAAALGRLMCRPALQVVDEIGCLPITSGGGNLLFQLFNRLRK